MTKPRTWWVVVTDNGEGGILEVDEGILASCEDRESAVAMAKLADSDHPQGPPHRALEVCDARELEKLRAEVNHLQQVLDCADYAQCDGCKEWFPRPQLSEDNNLCDECEAAGREEDQHRRELGE